MVQCVLVEYGAGSYRVGTFLVHICNPPQDSICRHFPFGHRVQRLHSFDQLFPVGGEGRRLSSQAAHLPMQNISHQGGRLVVQVVAHGHHREVSVIGLFVQDVALAQATSGTRHSAQYLGQGRDSHTIFLSKVYRDQGRSPIFGEFDGCGARMLGILVDAQVDMQAGRTVVVAQQIVPQRQAVLAAGHPNKDSVVPLEHMMPAYGPFHLPVKEFQIVGLTERRMMASELN